ncbi:MAG: hypothetical protein WC956_09800, partial [bacterium]
AGPYENSNLGYLAVAEQVAAGFDVVKSQPYFGRRISGRRDIVNAKTKDSGVEVTIRFEQGEGNFKVYKIASESNMKRIVGTYDSMERTFKAYGKGPREWCYLARRDLVFDCQMIPPDRRGDFKDRFLKAVATSVP